MKNRFSAALLLAWSVAGAGFCGVQAKMMSPQALLFSDGTLKDWEVEGDGGWTVSPMDDGGFKVSSSEAGTGVLKSGPFTITNANQSFSIAGADGTADSTNAGNLNYLRLRSWPDGEILRETRPPGTHVFTKSRWNVADLIGRKVYLEIVDMNPKLNPRGYAWIGLAGYRQKDWDLLKNPVQADDLRGLKIDGNAKKKILGTLPFWVAPQNNRGQTTRVVEGTTETIPVHAAAETLYLLGLINQGWGSGVAFWSEHPELHKKRTDQLHIGTEIGRVEIRYTDNSSDEFPLTMAVTAGFSQWWSPEPFRTRRKLADRWEKLSKLRKAIGGASMDEAYFLAVKPQNKPIESIVIHDNPDLRGQPLISAITLASSEKNADNLEAFGEWRADAADLKPAIKSFKPGDWSKEIEALSDLLYTSSAQLPEKVDPVRFPEGLDAAKIRFRGPVVADMLNNIWVANLVQIHEKFDAKTGFFGESMKGAPSYGGYMGVGTWGPVGSYQQWAFSRCSDHYASLALRCLDDEERLTSYVDFCDQYLYYHRSNHDPKLGPANDKFDIAKYPEDAPPHWAFIVNEPGAAVPSHVNEMAGNQEMDGHGATIMGRWMAWRIRGKPTDGWLTKSRKAIYGKSRWDTTVDSSEMICWLMDYTGMDVIYSEGETTGWGSGRVPEGMLTETDPVKIRQNYANAAMYEPYPTYTCLVGLKCSAQIADAVGDTAKAARWRAYAQRLEKGMIRLLAVGDQSNRVWRMGQSSIYPNQQECMVQAWYSIYYDGLDPQRLNKEMTDISRNTFQRQLNLPSGHHPLLGFGYGIGWLTKSALILDEMDDAGKLLMNIAKYSYDKNMDYVDAARDIDWRNQQWIIPEGVNLLPNGRWHRIGDLGNGANQGITLHALELCAGIDDTKPANFKIIPRVPAPVSGIAVADFPVMIPDNNGLARTKIDYSFDRESCRFTLKSKQALPSLSVRLGPYSHDQAQQLSGSLEVPSSAHIRVEESGTNHGQAAWWIWVEGMKNIVSLKIK